MGAFASALPPKARRVAPRAERRPASAHTHEERRLSRPRDGAQRVRCATINSECYVRGLECCERLESFLISHRSGKAKGVTCRCKSTEVGRATFILRRIYLLPVASSFHRRRRKDLTPACPTSDPSFFSHMSFTAFCDVRCRDGVRPPLLELFGRQLITKRCMAVPSQWVQPYWLAWHWCSYAVCREAQG